MQLDTDTEAVCDVAQVAWRQELVRTGLRSYTQFYSHRTRRRYLTYERGDRDLILILDTLPDVVDIVLRPAVVTFWHDGKQHQIEPVLLVRRHVAEEFWFDSATARCSASALESLRHQLEPLRLGLTIFDGASLLHPLKLEVAALLRRHARNPVDQLSREHARRELSRDQPVWFQDVVAGRHATLSATTVCRLIVEGGATLSPHGRLRPDTRVILTERNLNEESGHGTF